jgi:hypothetical protein
VPVAVGGRGSRNVSSWGRRNVSDRPTHWYGSVTAAARTMMVVCPCLHDKPCQQVCTVACHWQPCARGPGQWRRVCVCVCVFGPPGARTHARTHDGHRLVSPHLPCLPSNLLPPLAVRSPGFNCAGAEGQRPQSQGSAHPRHAYPPTITGTVHTTATATASHPAPRVRPSLAPQPSQKANVLFLIFRCFSTGV